MKSNLIMSEIAIPLNHLSNQTHEWTPGDTKENWLKNKKRFGQSWRYYDDLISYKFNNLGYRSKDFKDVPYFITLGCSYTMGVGIHEEDRYGDVLAKELGMHYLNFGIGGGSQNFVWMNNILLAKNLTRKPDFVVIQWPEIERLNTITDKGIRMFLPNFLGGEYATKSEKNLYLSMIDSPGFLYPQALSYYESSNLIWKSLGVKTINFTLSADSGELFGIYCLKGWTIDESTAGRDCVHPGPIHNKQIVEYIKGEL